MRGVRLAATVGLVLCSVLPAGAHERATARIERPDEGAVVRGEAAGVVIVATGSGTPAEFRLLLDGAPVDESGTVGGGALFTTFRLPAGQSKFLTLRLPRPGEHTLRLEPTAHSDRAEQPQERRFRSQAPGGGGGGAAPVLLAGAGLLAAGAVVTAYRRRRATAG